MYSTGQKTMLMDRVSRSLSEAFGPFYKANAKKELKRLKSMVIYADVREYYCDVFTTIS
jgi:hypothetical protein